ncbi:hypothetical protein [Clostridium perfringens]|uniref:hypothetical protein n=1 Tax=Clostridium perfringens TaxID=1502 RepID=UPI0024BD3B12|nr:hypothetical protein [Clostridium perfringens]
MEEKILELFEEKDRIKTKEIDINNNILKLDKETIQLSNISQISIDKPRKKISNKVWLIIILSFIMKEFSKAIAGVLLLGSIVYIILIFLKNENASYCLSIYQNYGGIYHISVKDESFLKKIREVLEECFNNSIKGATINIEKQTIEKQMIDAPITIGNNNSIKNDVTNNKIDNNNSSTVMKVKTGNINGNIAVGNNNKQSYKMEKYDWKLFESEFKNMLSKLPVNSDEYIACKNMLEVVEERNENLLKKTLTKYKKQFTSQLFLSTASSIFSKIILDIIGVNN